ncbi:HAD family phosphatase [Limosilactobacillus sp. STM2_1]|uniref:HAD family phosphatase n=1 Tax=Limosilactobacillus rudii TaxID=2759755 RepID=A0A7W3UKP2_9LACO|nr:HAD family hydrolase [Limosilactobacillus rudii]MBB1078722.1 HAD family phosphatase [Limosilactobacillus rudii]MBB1096710.1 HAD family phosphatase [Limosilactobacillus rudii]MCD7135618.1 Cof-type HAD-IIB family hydrolase [Limosilactobacillus rudii]
MNKYRFIAIDVDGTLLDDKDHFNIKRFNTDVAKLTQRGYHVIIASGNSYDALTSIFKPCPLIKNFVAENGGRIIINGQPITGTPHSLATLQLLLTTIDKSFPTPDILSLSGESQTFIASQYRDVPVPYYPHHDYFDNLQEINEPIYNLNISWFRKQLAQSTIQSYVKRLNADNIQATYSGAYGIDILPAGVNKANGLKQLVKGAFNGHMNEVMAFGDTSNDIEMLQEAGYGYAMKNATADLLRVADGITLLDNNHDGVLNEIEKCFLSQRI